MLSIIIIIIININCFLKLTPAYDNTIANLNYFYWHLNSVESNHDMSIERSLKSDSVRMHKITTVSKKRKYDASTLNQIKNSFNAIQQVSVSNSFVNIKKAKLF